MALHFACAAARAVLILALALSLCASRVSGQNNSPLQGQGKSPDGVTNLYFSAYLQRLLKVDDIQYQVRHKTQAFFQTLSSRLSLPTMQTGMCKPGPYPLCMCRCDCLTSRVDRIGRLRHLSLLSDSYAGGGFRVKGGCNADLPQSTWTLRLRLKSVMQFTAVFYLYLSWTDARALRSRCGPACTARDSAVTTSASDRTPAIATSHW